MPSSTRPARPHLTTALRLAATALATTALALATSPTPAQAASDGWQDYYADAGRVSVNTARNQITVCDQQFDDLYIKADFVTTYTGTWTVQAPQGDCTTDRTWISKITTVTLCGGTKLFDTVRWNDCNTPLRITR
ncbi:hypothetical protein DP939_25275 [Spongiactinospora rosea]|uniref:Uncharacterized protein n=1 Tax=Spongiactinospora rosea TaxID=2248750 RepID=A0A366LUJ9_9ACTN|nr:hypothetical protein [Spongiactinospora rosea]RBQ17260.1 hypothetical protein DP939_25275 [Spongiactinospora rosea]